MRLCLGAGRKASAMCFALRHQCQYEQLPGGLCVFPLVCQHTRDGAEAGPVRNLKERWGVGTEGLTGYFRGVFGKAARAVLLQKEF